MPDSISTDKAETQYIEENSQVLQDQVTGEAFSEII